MFQRLLLVLLIIVGIGLLVWRFSDSGAEIARRKQFFTNPFTVLFDATHGSTTPTVGVFPFPAVATLQNPTLDTALSDDTYNTPRRAADITDELTDIEQQYDTLTARIVDAKQFGDPSPYRGLITIADSYSGAEADDPALEHITLVAHSGNTAPVSITGWSLQSLYGHTRVMIPNGTRTFAMGQVSLTAPIALDPGDRAVVTTGASPVGLSFKENLCTGYLGQFQTFVPSLEERCPSAESEVLAEPATSRAADPACVAYARTLSSCRFPFGDPPDVSSLCYAFIRNSLTYSGCVARHSWRPSFNKGEWRIFLNQSRELWQGDHDVVRLLDAQGRTVDVWSY